VPAILTEVGEDEEGVGVFGLQAGDDGAFRGQEEAVGVQLGVDDLEALIITGPGEEDGILGEQGSLVLGPLPTGNGLADTFVVQLRPEEPLEGIEAVESPE